MEKLEKKKEQRRNNTTLFSLICIAMFTAVTVVCSQIQIPLGPVPFTLQTMAVFIASGLMGARRGTLSVALYLLLGALGLPVFAQFSGGIGVILGPTGGYIVGFVLTALITGLGSDIFRKNPVALIISMTLGLLLCYAVGTAWFIFVTNRSGGNMGLMTALGYCVFPFLIPDGVKIAFSAVLVNRLSRLVQL